MSRQLGSGGAYIGQELAKKLDIYYLDREIIRLAAKKLSVLEDELESLDERKLSFWESFLQSGGYISSSVYIPPPIFTPTDRELFKTEAEIMKNVVNERSAVIIGRCGSHILHAYPNHTSIFLHADIDFRKKRIEKLYNVSQEEASKMITKSDSERARYHHMLTGKEWTDARQYNLSIDTSKIGVDNCVQFILQYLELV
nr:cytidylate kinase-like family protein [Methanosarcina vacuolata]